MLFSEIIISTNCKNVNHVMEQDISESAKSTLRRPVTTNRRRTRSTGSLPWGKFSGESSSSMDECDLSRDIGLSSLQQSDSDDISGAQAKESFYNIQLNRMTRTPFPSIESDSVNENISPLRPTTRRSRSLFKVLHRKRKLKRKTVMSDGTIPSTSTGVIQNIPSLPNSCTTSAVLDTRKKRILRHGYNCENRYCSGGSKRKRSARGVTDHPRTVLSLNRLSLKDDVPHHAHSSSSISSSESDPGIFTNDEGGEGDDEQSDWVGDCAAGGIGPWDESDKAESMDDDIPAELHRTRYFLVKHRNRHVNYHRFTDRVLRGREIRGGKRRLNKDKQSFSVMTSANEKLLKFLNDPDITQLRLHPMQENERSQLSNLAELYSLDMQFTSNGNGLICPILTKTCKTVQVEPMSRGNPNAFFEFKRRRCNTEPITVDDVDICDEPMDDEHHIFTVQNSAAGHKNSNSSS